MKTTYIGQIYECNSGTGQCTKYIFAGSQRIAEVKGAEVNYYHTDHLGSSSIITDSTGNKVEDLYYYPYGEIKTNTGSVNVKHKFAGHEDEGVSSRHATKKGQTGHSISEGRPP